MYKIVCLRGSDCTSLDQTDSSTSILFPHVARVIPNLIGGFRSLLVLLVAPELGIDLLLAAGVFVDSVRGTGHLECAIALL